MSKKMFDVAIFNPPYQESQDDTSDKPIYNKFIDAAIKVSKEVEVITPARFLFNAGKTPKQWNKKMLNSPHFKVLKYEKNGNDIFPNTEIKGGVAITYYNQEKECAPIQIFIDNKILNSIFHKVFNHKNFNSLSDVVFSPESYKFSKEMYIDHPEILSMTYDKKGKKSPVISKGHDYDLTSNIFEKLDNVIFFKDRPKNNFDYILVYGRKENKRCKRWIKKDYISNHPNLNNYKILFSKSSGSGKFGEQISQPVIGNPNEAHTQTFISIGSFQTEYEAFSANKYIKTKFARTMLGILKVTQDNKKGVWKYVPLQDFTDHSDIDWSKSIPEIDQQLYRKYGLSDEEIDFIETHVKEMK